MIKYVKGFVTGTLLSIYVGTYIIIWAYFYIYNELRTTPYVRKRHYSDYRYRKGDK